MQQTKMTLQELMDAAEARLVELNYAPQTIYVFRCYWRDLLSYAEIGTRNISQQNQWRNICWNGARLMSWPTRVHWGLPRWRIRPYKRAIYLLAKFQKSGVVLRKRKMEWSEVSARFVPILEHYLAVARSRYNSEGTVTEKSFTIKLFPLHVDQKKIQDRKQLTHRDITSFLETRVTWAQRTVATTIFCTFITAGINC